MLSLGDTGAAGGLSPSSVIVDNGELRIYRSNAVTQGVDFSSAPITGTGMFTQAGAGTTTLNAANTFSGTTSITGGTLAYDVDNALGSGGVVINGSGTLNIGAFSDSVGVVLMAGAPGTITGTTGVLTGTAFVMAGTTNTVSANLGGLGSTLQVGSTRSILSGANIFTGNTTILSGTLQLGNGGTTGSLSPASAIALSSTVSLTINRSNDLAQGTDFSTAPITGAGSFIQAGTGTTTLNAANTYSGATTVLAGTLALSNALAIQNSAIDTSGNGTITLNGPTTLTIGGLNGSKDLASVITTGYSGLTALTLNPGSGVTNIYSGVIANGAMTVTKSGLGTQVLSGANTYTGNTTITQGTLQIGNGGTTGNLSASSAISNNGTLAINRSTAMTQGTDFAAITGSGALTQAGTGTTTLTANNTYTGATTVSAGTLQLNRSTGSLAASALTFNGNGGTFNMDNTGAAAALTQGLGALTFTAGESTVKTTRTADFDQKITFTSLAARAAGAVGNFVNSGVTNSATNGFVLTGKAAGFIDKGIFYGGSAYASMNATGNYTRALNYSGDGNATTSSGNTTLASIAHQQITGNITAQNTATFTTFNISGANNLTLAAAQTVTVDGILKSGSGNATISQGTGLTISSGGELVIRTDLADDSLTISNNILANGTNALTKSGAGTLTLSGANTYNGTTTVLAGTLAYGASNALLSGAVTVNGGTLAMGTFSDTVGAVTLASGSITGSTGVLTGTSYSLTNSGAVSAILGGAVALTKTGLGTVILSGANTYTGTTTVGATGGVNAGILQLSGSGKISNAATTVFGGTLDLNGTNQTITTLTLGGGASGSAANVLIGSGNLTLGGDITYTATNNPNGATISGAGIINLMGARSFAVGESTAPVDLTVSAIIANGSAAANGITLAGGSTGGGTMVLSGANTYSGTTTVSGGVLNIQNATALGFGGIQTTATGGTTVSYGSTLDLNGTTGINEPITISGTSIDGKGALTNSSGTDASIGNGVAGIQLPTATTGSGYSSAPTVTISGTGTLATATATLGVTAASFTAGATGGKNYTVAPTVTISGGGGLGATATAVLTSGQVTGITITNAGVGYTTAPSLALSGGTFTGTGDTAFTGNANQFAVSGVNMTAAGSGYTGTTTYTFSAGNATPGSVALSSVILAANSSIGGSGNTTINAVVSGAFSLTKDGAGTLTLSGVNTFTGNTLVSAGTLAVNNTALQNSAIDTSGAGNITVTGTAPSFGGLIGSKDLALVITTGYGTVTALTLNGTSTVAYSGVIDNGAMTLTKAGAGSQTLSGANTYTGLTTISAGVLNIQNATALGTTENGTSVASGAALELQNNITVGAEALTLNGTGVGTAGALRNISGTNTYGGNITLAAASRINSDAGTLTLNGTAAITGATFGLTVGGAGNTTISSAIGTGTGTLTKDGAGTVILSGANTYTGTTTVGAKDAVNAGILQISGSGKLSNAATIVYGGTLDLTSTSQTITTLALGGGASGSTANVIIDSGGVLDLGDTVTYSATNNPNGATISGNGTLNLNGIRTFTVNNSTAASVDLTVSAIIANGNSTSKLSKDSATGTLELTGNNTYTGITAINGGVLIVSNIGDGGVAGNIGQASSTESNIELSATLRYTGATASTNRLFRLGATTAPTLDASGTGAITFSNTGLLGYIGGTGSRTFTLAGTNTDSNTFAPLISDSNVASGNATTVVKSGVGTWVLTGNNTYTGTTTVGAGTLAFNSGNTSATGTQSLGKNATVNLGVALTSSGILNYVGNGSATLAKAINALGSGTDTIQNSGGGLLTLNGTLTKNGTVLTLKGGSSGINVTGAIVGANAGSDLIVDGGNTTLSATNSYNGPTSIINGATLTANATGALPTGNRTAISMDQTGSGNSTLVLGGGFSQAAASLTGNTTSAIHLNANTLTVGTSTGNTTFAGVISGGGSLVKDGASTLVLTGNNTFSGTTAISDGTLEAGAAAALGSTSGVTVATGGTLLLSANSTTNSTATLALGNGTVALKQSGAGVSNTLGALTLTASSTIDFGAITEGNNILTLGGVTTWAPGQILNIWNWSGTPQTTAGPDHLMVSSTAGWDTNLSSINFYSDAGSTLVGGGGAMFVGYELTAVPEPSTWVAMAALVLTGAFFKRKRQNPGLR